MTFETAPADIRQEVERQLKIIARKAVDIIPEDEFKDKLADAIANNRPLRIKQGFDPTSPDIHIGHAVGIRKLLDFQTLGHQIVLIVGDYTAMVGDPSGVSATRPKLSLDEVMANARTYQDQFFEILDRDKTEVRFNSEWFKAMDFEAVMELAAKFTVARILERDDFEKRMRRGVPISIHEMFYPLMQGYDSVAIRSDLEMGGTDQKFNLLAGRTIQEAYGQEPQAILTMPLLVGLDGEKKMSKSLGNYIGITEPPREIFGKAMSIPDDLIATYYELAADISEKELAEVKKQLQDTSINPMNLKKKLAEALVDLYHPTGSGQAAREEFERIFSQKKLPDNIPEMSWHQLQELGFDDPSSIFLVGLINKAGLAKSNSEARKLMQSNAVSINDEKITDPDFELNLNSDMILRVGKRRFLKLKAT